MHIAVSGTHGIGKTTFIDDIVKKYPQYSWEPEPYYQLQDSGLSELELQPTIDSFTTQLEYSIKQLNTVNTANVIFDRCPIDFIAYIMYIVDQEMTNILDTAIAEVFQDVKLSLDNLDLIIFLPITEAYDFQYTEEDPKYRDTIDYFLKQLYREEICDVFPSYNHPRIIEVYGNQASRMKQVTPYFTT